MTDNMTIEQAIKVLANTPYLRKPNGDTDLEYKWAIDMAIEALEKQIPKKPNTYSDYMRCGRVVNTCPICCKRFDEYVEFCDGCGQAIDWESDTE